MLGSLAARPHLLGRILALRSHQCKRATHTESQALMPERDALSLRQLTSLLLRDSPKARCRDSTGARRFTWCNGLHVPIRNIDRLLDIPPQCRVPLNARALRQLGAGARRTGSGTSSCSPGRLRRMVCRGLRPVKCKDVPALAHGRWPHPKNSCKECRSRNWATRFTSLSSRVCPEGDGPSLLER